MRFKSRAKIAANKRMALLNKAAKALGLRLPGDEDGWNDLLHKTDAQLEALIYTEGRK